MLMRIGWSPGYGDLAYVPARVLELYQELRLGQSLAPTEAVRASGTIGGVQVGAGRTDGAS